MEKFHTIEVKSLSDFTSQLESRITDKYRVTLFRGQTTDKPLIPKIARHKFKKSREVDEKRMFEEFNLQSIQYLTFLPQNELEQLTVAQHHGLPTRLLDWTESALAALYFAVNSIPEEGDNAVVWVLSAERDSPILITDQNINVFEQEELKLFKPSTIIQRVSSQHGWFTIHPFKGQGFYERADKKNEDLYRLNKIIIKPGCSKKILQTLESCGINSHTIFRDLDSLGSYLFQKYKFERKD